MDLQTALAIFRLLEECRETEYEGDPPTYKVRLDAGVNYSTGARDYRVRVVAAQGTGTRDSWQYVMETAVEQGVELDVQNAGLELS